MSMYQPLYNFFLGFGPIGILVGLFVIVVLDAMLIPLGLEFLSVLAFTLYPMFSFPPLLWAAGVILSITAGQVGGTLLLYHIGKHPKLLPRWIKKVMLRYQEILIIKGEKIVLLNCFVPLIPFLGAFIAVCRWGLRRSILFVILGGLTKFSLLIGMSIVFYQTFSVEWAQRVSLIAAICVIAISVVYSLRCRKKLFPGVFSVRKGKNKHRQRKQGGRRVPLRCSKSGT